jgi:hypothetical protein
MCIRYLVPVGVAVALAYVAPQHRGSRGPGRGGWRNEWALCVDGLRRIAVLFDLDLARNSEGRAWAK